MLSIITVWEMSRFAVKFLLSNCDISLHMYLTILF